MDFQSMRFGLGQHGRQFVQVDGTRLHEDGRQLVEDWFPGGDPPARWTRGRRPEIPLGRHRHLVHLKPLVVAAQMRLGHVVVEVACEAAQHGRPVVVQDRHAAHGVGRVAFAGPCTRSGSPVESSANFRPAAPGTPAR